MSIEQLNTIFAIDGHLRIVQGHGGFPMIEVDNGKATALISIFAGQVLSYRPVLQQEDLFFLSDLAYYQEGKGIKGGIPVCWPWFGPDPEGKGRPGHGFVRDRFWHVVKTAVTVEGDTLVVLGIKDSQESRSLWPYAFEVQVVITVGAQLRVELVTRNIGDQAYTITQGLHSYFKVGDIAKASVSGLEDLDYLDKVGAEAQRSQEGKVTFAGEVNRIYLAVEEALVIEDAAFGRRIHIAAEGSNTAVVWNPWAKVCAEMGDLRDDDFQHFVCVETTNAASDIVEVLPGSTARLAATFSVES